MLLDPSDGTNMAQEIVARRIEFSTFLTYPSKNISYLLNLLLKRDRFCNYYGYLLQFVPTFQTSSHLHF
jgi:hypothetical protein